MADGAWDCPDCGHHNAAAATCEVCGVARRYLLDPPLDLPYPPRLRELPSFYLALLWASLAALGLALLAVPGWREALGLGRTFLAIEVVGALLAAGSSLASAWWDRWFNAMTLAVPGTVRTGEAFDVTLTLVPYDRVPRATVRVRLVDNFYQRGGEAGVETRSRTLERQAPLLGEPLTGRRAHVLTARFTAPFPATRHTDVRAELNASVFAVLAIAVPALGWTARNLREHGGYYVEATVRVGLLRRTLKRRVIAYHLGAELLVG